MVTEKKTEKEKSVRFSEERVLATLDGSKTQFRRIVEKPEFIHPSTGPYIKEDGSYYFSDDEAHGEEFKLPYKIGNTLFVQETYSEHEGKIYYRCDQPKDYKGKWVPSIFMPVRNARLFLTITNVRIEKLQEITEQDAITEGVLQVANFYYKSYSKTLKRPWVETAKESYRTLWDSKNYKGENSWKNNPWVFVYEFKIIARKGI